MAEIAAAGADGLAVALLSPAERTQLRALVAAGLARIEQRADRRVEGAGGGQPRVAAPSLNAAQADGGGGARRRAGGRLRQLPAPRRHRLGQDRGLPARHRGGARGRAGGAGAGAGDRADAAAGGALPRPASATTSRCCTAASPTRAAGAPGGGCARRGRHRARRALGGVRAGASARRGRRRRGARRVVQAGGGRPLPRARRGAGARAARRGGGVLGSATPSLESTRNATRGRFTRCSCCPSARDAAAAAAGRDRRPARHPRRTRRRCSRRRWPRRSARRWRRASRRILFLNRRGFSTVRAVRRLRPGRPLPELRGVADLPPRRDAAACATTAAHRTRVPERCPACKPPRARAAGHRHRAGARRSCASAFPTRAWPGSIATPRDRRGDSTRCSARMRGGEVDILVGTQMVTKGHDFPGVTLVGVLHGRPGAGPARLSRRRADLPAARAGGGAGRARRAPGPRASSRPTSPTHPAIGGRCGRTTTRLRRAASWRRARSRLSRRSPA